MQKFQMLTVLRELKHLQIRKCLSVALLSIVILSCQGTDYLPVFTKDWLHELDNSFIEFEDPKGNKKQLTVSVKDLTPEKWSFQDPHEMIYLKYKDQTVLEGFQVFFFIDQIAMGPIVASSNNWNENIPAGSRLIRTSKNGDSIYEDNYTSKPVGIRLFDSLSTSGSPQGRFLKISAESFVLPPSWKECIYSKDKGLVSFRTIDDNTWNRLF